MDSEYREKQKLDDLWWYIMLAVLAAVNMYLYRYLGEKNLNHLYWSISILLFFGFFLAVFSLKTRFSREGIYYQLLPFHLKERFLPWSGIEYMELKTIRPIRDYGGYGYRLTLYSSGYIMQGKTALIIHVEGKSRKFVFTVKDPDKVRNHITRYSKKLN